MLFGCVLAVGTHEAEFLNVLTKFTLFVKLCNTFIMGGSCVLCAFAGLWPSLSQLLCCTTRTVQPTGSALRCKIRWTGNTGAASSTSTANLSAQNCLSLGEASRACGSPAAPKTLTLQTRAYFSDSSGPRSTQDVRLCGGSESKP